MCRLLIILFLCPGYALSADSAFVEHGGFIVPVIDSAPGNYPVAKSHYVNGKIAGEDYRPASFYFDDYNGIEVITSYGPSAFYFRDIGSTQSWTKSPKVGLNQPHSLVYSNSDMLYYAVDTKNNRIIAFSSLSDQNYTEFSSIEDISGNTLVDFATAVNGGQGERPHDLVYDPSDGYTYLIYFGGIARFRTNGASFTHAEVLSKQDIESGINDPSFTFSYSRSISLVDGTLYIANTRFGNVIEVANFSAPSTWTVHFNTHTQNLNEPTSKGIWSVNGLVLNDIDYADGYWYGANFYGNRKATDTTPATNYSDAEVNTNKLIRWKTWDDFRDSNWDDLTYLTPERLPYSFRKHQGKVYLNVIADPPLGSAILSLETTFDQAP